jgi:hypothetical protein
MFKLLGLLGCVILLLSACEQRQPIIGSPQQTAQTVPTDPPSPFFPIQVDGLLTDPNQIVLKVNESLRFKSLSLITPGQANAVGRQDFFQDYAKFSFQSQAPEIASVDAKGEVKGLKQGQTLIKILYEGDERLQRWVPVKVE